MFSTIKAKLLAFFLSLVLFAFLSSFFANYYLRKNEKKLSEIVTKIERINNLVWEDIRVTRDFFSNETINSNFYKSGVSPYLNTHYDICKQIDSSMILLNESQLNQDFELDSKIINMSKLFLVYRTSMDSIIKNIVIRGFKDFGIEGEMRNYAHLLENYEKEIGPADILELRRHEKDFIIRQEDQYVVKHKKLSDNVRLRLMSSHHVTSDKKNEILSILNKYTISFNKMVLYDKKIGLKTQSGIKKGIDNRIDDMAVSFNSIKAAAEIKVKLGLARVQNIYLSIWIIYLIISISFSIYISRKFSMEVSMLKNRVVKFINSDFTKKNIFPVKSSKYEIDILSTQLNIMEKHISKLMIELKETNTELQTFIYRASHDLKSPVSSIQGLVNVAKFDTLDSNTLEYFSMIDSSCFKLYSIIEELALINVIKKGEIENREVNIQDLIFKTIAGFKSTNDLDNIIFSAEFIIKSQLYSDERLLRIIVYNLIENSIKYSKNVPGFSFIKIRVTQDVSEMIRIDIEDNGVGIKKDVQQNIFDMFFRDTNLANSSGLGLYIVQNSLKRLKGAIKLQSEEGCGTTFSVYLPNAVRLKKIAERVVQNEQLVAAHSQLALNYV